MRPRLPPATHYEAASTLSITFRGEGLGGGIISDREGAYGLAAGFGTSFFSSCCWEEKRGRRGTGLALMTSV